MWKYDININIISHFSTQARKVDLFSLTDRSVWLCREIIRRDLVSIQMREFYGLLVLERFSLTDARKSRVSG